MQNRERLVHALFGSIGISLILCAYVVNQLVSTQLWSDVVKDIGVVVLSVTIVQSLWRVAGGEPIQEKLDEIRRLSSLAASSAEIGMRKIYPRATEVTSDDWLKLIRSSRRQIDFSSHSMSQLLDEPHLWNAIQDRVRSGTVVRVLMMAPDNPALDTSGAVTSDYLDSRRQVTRDVRTALLAARSSLPVEIQSNIDIRWLTNQTMFVAVRRFDDAMYVAQYLYTDNMRNNTQVVIQGAQTPLFVKYATEFDGLFGLAEAIHEIR